MEAFKSSLPLLFTVTELVAWHMSRGILGVFNGTVCQWTIECLFAKLKTSLLPETIQYFDRISQRVTVGKGPARDYKAIGEIISQVSEATGQRKRVQILYKAASTQKETTRKIDPYKVWVTNGRFYLMGLRHLRVSVRWFVLEHVKKLTVFDEPIPTEAEHNNGDGTFAAGTAFGPASGKTESIDLGDVDGDGWLDLVHDFLSSVTYFLRLEGPFWNA
ncbi:WYL domain-containing protein [Thermodesulfobacteriota bacterium]